MKPACFEIARDTEVGSLNLVHRRPVGHLLYNHIVPPLPLAPMIELFVEGVDEVYSGPVTVGPDAMLVQMPADSDATSRSRSAGASERDARLRVSASSFRSHFVYGRASRCAGRLQIATGAPAAAQERSTLEKRAGKRKRPEAEASGRF